MTINEQQIREQISSLLDMDSWSEAERTTVLDQLQGAVADQAVIDIYEKLSPADQAELDSLSDNESVVSGFLDNKFPTWRQVAEEAASKVVDEYKLSLSN